VKARLLLFSLLLLLGSFAPARGDGTILFENRNVENAAGDLQYNVPIFVDLDGNGLGDPGEGLGTVALNYFNTNATLGLFLQGNPTPIVTARFRADTNGAFLGSPSSQTAQIPGYQPGDRAPLRVRAWVGPSFETSVIRGSWDFISEPLGGITLDGHIIFPPGMAGWGDPATSAGYVLTIGSAPVVVNDRFTRPLGGNLLVTPAMLLANDSDP